MHSIKTRCIFTSGLTEVMCSRPYHWWHGWDFSAILIDNSDGF